MKRPSARLGRLAAWLLPAAVVWFLVSVHFRIGWFGVPYWASLLGPVAAVVAAWAMGAQIAAVRAERERDRGSSPLVPRSRSGRLFVAGVATVVLVVLAIAWPLHLVPHARLGRLNLLGLALGGLTATGIGTYLGWRTGRLPGAFELLALVAVSSMVETDLYVTSYWFDRDFHIFLRAGHNFLAGQPVYFVEPPAVSARDPSLSPFVYPPVTLPLFALLASLPSRLADGIWLLMGLGAAIGSLRLFGVRWRWLPVLLLWPPFVQGLFVGNADIPVLVFFAAAPLASSSLALPPLVKLQLGIPGLWLVRERRWLGAGGAVLIGLVLIVATLPLVRLELWWAWFAQLGAFARFAEQNPPVQGIALQRSVGPMIAASVAVAAVLFALTRRGRAGLASLGLASLVASPTLYPHSVTLGVAGFLRLRGGLLWVVLALTSSVYGTESWWVAIAIGLLAPLVPAFLRAGGIDAGIHPLGDGVSVWPFLAEDDGRDPNARAR